MAGKPATSPRSISWPRIYKSPEQVLSLIELLPGLLVIDHLFSPQTLLSWIQFLTAPTTPIILTPSPPKQRGEASRTNDRFSVDDRAFAEVLWQETGLRELCQGEGGLEGAGREKKKPLGLNSNIRLYRYTRSAYFGREWQLVSLVHWAYLLADTQFSAHYDDEYVDKQTEYKSEWTLLIYLTGEDTLDPALAVKGGETSFYPNGVNKKGGGKSVDVAIKEGRAVLHRHGSDCMLHEGKVVREGVKWVLRSDVMFG